MIKCTNLQETAIENARRAAVMMSTERFPIGVVSEKIEHDKRGLWLTLETKHTTVEDGNMLHLMTNGHWFIRITRRGKATIYSGPHWAEGGVYGMHAAKDGYFGS